MGPLATFNYGALTVTEKKAYFLAIAEFASANLNLCMAAKLKEQLESLNVLIATDEDRLALQAIFQERAELAVVAYSLFGKALRSNGALGSSWDGSVSAPSAWLSIFQRWAKTAAPSDVARIGSDLHAAVALHVEATEGLADVLKRKASARKGAIAPSGIADKDWGTHGATGVLINIVGGPDMKMREIQEAASLIQEQAHEDANIIFGASIHESMGDTLKVTVIATGFDQEHKAEPVAVLRDTMPTAERNALRDIAASRSIGRPEICRESSARPERNPYRAARRLSESLVVGEGRYPEGGRPFSLE